MTNDFDPDFQTELSGLQPRELSEHLEEQILQQLEQPMPVTIAPSRRRLLRPIAGVAAVVCVVAIVVATIVSHWKSGDADSDLADLASHRPNPPAVTPGASARGESFAIKPDHIVDLLSSSLTAIGERRQQNLDAETTRSLMAAQRVSRATMVKYHLPKAKVIVVATGLGFAPDTSSRDPSDHLIFWLVTRVIKGQLTEKVFSTQASSSYYPENIRKWYIGRETIVMLPPAGYFQMQFETLVKAILPKDDVAKARQIVLKKRSAAELDADWRALRGDATTAYPALGRLVSSPDNAVAFLGKQLQKTKPVDNKRIKRLIADLDADLFQIRERATKELSALRDLAGPALRKALAGKPSPEAKARLAALLARLVANPSPEMIQQKRAVQALQFIGSAEARQLLKKLAAGPSTWLTQEAKAAAARLAKRASVAP